MKDFLLKVFICIYIHDSTFYFTHLVKKRIKFCSEVKLCTVIRFCNYEECPWILSFAGWFIYHFHQWYTCISLRTLWKEKAEGKGEECWRRVRQGHKHGDTALSKERREQVSKKTAWQLHLKQRPSGQDSCICMPLNNKQPRIREQTSQGHSLSLVVRA